ncbi:MAG: hypothetical protein TYPL_4580 [Candidatus Tyloplasma litorale]|nr:MAG: hypothetical protein TYPL_4580 [Mycoplasmatales bacterium]
MINWINKLSVDISNREYALIYNGKKINFNTKRIKNIKDYYNFLIRDPRNNQDYSFFLFNEYNIATFGLSQKIDVVFVNWNGSIINLEENFETNKISKKYTNTKFIYLFPSGTIKKKNFELKGVLKHEFSRKK